MSRPIGTLVCVLTILRREAGFRLLEAGVPLYHIKQLVGHSNISQSDTYLNAGTVDLRKSMLLAEINAQPPAN